MITSTKKEASLLAGVYVDQASGPEQTGQSKEPCFSINIITFGRKNETPPIAQCISLIKALQSGQVITVVVRQILDMPQRAARVQELREAGNSIQTVWGKEAAPCGAMHRVGKYSLVALVLRTGGTK